MAEITPELLELVEELNFNYDVKQDFYVKYLNDEYMEFDNMEHMRGYVITALHNMTQNDRRVEVRRKEIEVESHDEIVRMFNMDEDASDPLDLLVAEEEITNKMAGLSTLLRDTVEDYYVKGMTPEAIAERDGDNVEAVRKRITRARNILKGE